MTPKIKLGLNDPKLCHASSPNDLLLNISLNFNIGYIYSKTFLSSHSNIDKTKVLKTNGSQMKVESIAECSLGAFCNTFDLH